MDCETTTSGQNAHSEPHIGNEPVSGLFSDQATLRRRSGDTNSNDQVKHSTIMVSSGVEVPTVSEAVSDLRRVREPISKAAKATSGKQSENEQKPRSTLDLFRRVINRGSVTPTAQETVKEIHRAITLMDQCKANISFDKLDNAISMLCDVLSRRPATHPLHIDTMRHLASALTVKLFYTKQIAGMNDILSFYKNTTLDDIKQSDTYIHKSEDVDDDNIVESAKTCITGFNASISRDTVDDVVSSLRTCLPLPPSISDNTKLQALTALADALYTRFRNSNSRSDSDLESAIKHLSDALKYCEDDSPTRAYIMLRMLTLAAENWELFVRRPAYIDVPQTEGTNGTRDAAVRDAGKAAQKALAKYMHDVYLSSLQQLRDIHGHDLDEAISFYKSALLDNSENKESILNKLGFTLFARFEQTGDGNNIEEAISVHKQALQLLPSPSSKRASHLANLGCILLKRYETEGQPNEQDITDSIAHIKEALALLNDQSHSDRPLYLNNLAAALLIQCDKTSSIEDINEAVKLNKQALGLMSDLPQRYKQLAYLASSLEHREFISGLNPNDLDDAIDLRRNVLQLNPLEAKSHCDLGLAVFARYVRKQREDDLKEAISSLQSGLKILPPSHVNRHKFNTYLANMLYLNGQFDAAMKLQQQTLRNLVEPSIRGDILHCMADYLLQRSTKNGNSIGLDEAIPWYKEALSLRQPPNPYRLTTVNHLAIALFEVDRKNLNEALSLIEDNLKLEPLGHHARPNSCVLLGEMHSYVSWLTPDKDVRMSHLQHAIEYFAQSLKLPTQLDADRFKNAKKWIVWADQLQHPSALDAYDVALHHLPRLASLGSLIESRLEMLMAESDGLARQAARCAIRHDKLEKAVEYLESGRAVLWSQMLKLRSPVDSLQIKAPELAQKLCDTAAELERGSHHRKIFENMVGNEKKILLEREEVRYKRLNDAREKYIEEVRNTVEGFADFLRPRSLKALQVAAAAHPIVFLIANGGVDGSACLIMTATGPPHHIPLPKLPAEELRQLAKMINTDAPSKTQPKSRSATDDLFVLSLSIADHTTQTFERSPGEYILPDDPLSDESFWFVLTTLWNEVVKPVIDYLGIKKAEGHVPMERLLWCPTGLFTFLPIHAAGCYTDSGTLIEDASQYIVSSYTPTIEVLLSQDEPSNTGPASEKFEMLAVIDSQGLRSAPVELYEISKQVPKECLVALGASHGDTATVARVVAHLQTASIAHFACHGTQDTKDPLQSVLQVCAGPDGRLTIATIMEKPLPHGALAVLFACQTATGDANVPDEAMSLGASLLYSGYRSVVATMWKMRDEDGPVIAETFYKELAPAGYGSKPGGLPDISRSAYALTVAVKKLRSQNVEFRRWVPFIHLGK